MDLEVLKTVAPILLAVGAAVAGAVRWGVIRITKSIDGAAAAATLAADKAASAQLAAAERFAAAQLEHAKAAQEQAVAFAELRGEVHAVAEYIQDRPSSRAAGSGGRSFSPGG